MSTPYSEKWPDTVTLATIATIGPMSIKQHVFNRWSSDPSLRTSYRNVSAPPSSLSGFQITPIYGRDIFKSIRARAHSLIGGSNTTGVDDRPINTMAR